MAKNKYNPKSFQNRMRARKNLEKLLKESVESPGGEGRLKTATAVADALATHIRLENLAEVDV